MLPEPETEPDAAALPELPDTPAEAEGAMAAVESEVLDGTDDEVPGTADEVEFVPEELVFDVKSTVRTIVS